MKKQRKCLQLSRSFSLIEILTDDTHTVLPENLVAAVKSVGHSEVDVEVNMREGYDHSYYFISTFAPDHVKYHAKILKQ